MKCQVCKTKEAEPNSIVCSDRCNKIRLLKMDLSNVVTPTNGCDNCWGDLHQGCTYECKDELKRAGSFGKEMWTIIRKYI